jgi:hypothetical protein
MQRDRVGIVEIHTKATVHFAYEPSNRYLAILRLFQVLTNRNVTMILNKKDWTAIL